MPAVTLLGDINVDLLLAVPAYPGEGGEAIARRLVQQLGGSATNTAISLARLGIEARMLGRVGSDAFGDGAIAGLANAGVATSLISRDAVEPTQLNVVAVSDGGERTMFVYRGANAQLAPDQVTPEALAGVELVHLSGYALLQSPQRDAARALIEMAGAARIPVSLDIPAGIAHLIGPCVRESSDLFDIVLLGEADFAALGLSDASDLIHRGARLVVVKSGAAGCSGYTETESFRVAGLSVPVVDATGAGDALAAGIVAGHLAGLSDQAACLLGTLLGAVAVGRPGAGLEMPGLSDVAAVLGNMARTAPAARELAQWIASTSLPQPCPQQTPY